MALWHVRRAFSVDAESTQKHGWLGKSTDKQRFYDGTELAFSKRDLGDPPRGFVPRIDPEAIIHISEIVLLNNACLQ